LNRETPGSTPGFAACGRGRTDLGACLRNKSMRVRVLPSALFEHGPVAQMDESACLRNRRSQVRVLPGSLKEFWIADYVISPRRFGIGNVRSEILSLRWS